MADPGFTRRVISPQAVGIYLFFLLKTTPEKKKKLNRRAFLVPLIYPPLNPIYNALLLLIMGWQNFPQCSVLLGVNCKKKFCGDTKYIPFVKKYKKLDHCRTQGLFQRIHFTVGRKILCKKIPVCV